jgi:Flp pilus assembly protein TadD
MRRTRYMTWVFLILSLAFFTIRDFRFALEAPLASLWAERLLGLDRDLSPKLQYTPWLARLYTLDRYAPPAQLIALADDAAQRGDTEFVAFAAMNLGPRKDALRLADRAVDANPDLTWIYSFVVPAATPAFPWEGPSEITSEELTRRVERLETFDPDNGFPHALHASVIRVGRAKEWPGGNPTAPSYLDALARQTTWCEEMDKAFRSPKYDSYQIRYLELMRRVLRARGWDHPVIVATITELRAIPNLLWVRDYTNLLVQKYGAQAEVAGKLNEALDDYFLAVEFGGRLRRGGNSLIEQLIGVAVQHIASPKLAAALRKAGRENEARLAEDLDRQGLQFVRESRNPLRATSYNFWLVLLANFAAGLVGVFLLASLISVVYVNAKLWVRKEKKGRLYQSLTVAENYAPLLLFLSCLALYLSDAPFRRHYENLMTAQVRVTDPSTHASIYPAWGLSTEINRLDVPNAFQDYVPIALAGVILLTGVLGLGLWRERRKQSLPEAAAFQRKLQTQNYAVLLLAAVAFGTVVALAPPWEISMTAGIVVALLLAATLWTSASFARHIGKTERNTWASKAAEGGAYLLLLVLAGISGGLAGYAATYLMTHHRLNLNDWACLLAFALPPLMAGVLSASRLRFRRATPAAFCLLVVAIVGFLGLQERKTQKSLPGKSSASARPTSNVAPPLTEPEVLVAVAEGLPGEQIAQFAQAARLRGVAFHQGFWGLWVLREAGAGDYLIKTFRAAKWAKDRSLAKQANQLADAEKALRGDIKRNPENPALHFALGLVLSWQEKEDSAVAEYRTALRLKPDFAGAHRALGEAVMQNGQIGAAIAELRQAARLDANDALARGDLARALYQNHDKDEAMREYRAEVYLERGDCRARYMIARDSMDRGEFASAVWEFRDLLGCDPEIESFVRIYLPEALRKNGDLEEAITEYRELVRMFPQSGRPYDLLGQVLAEHGELTAAIKELREAIRLDPKSADPHNDLGLTLQRTGNLDGAIGEFQQAIHLEPDNADAHASLARALEKKGDLEGASEQFRIARRLKPEDRETQADYDRLSRQLRR